MDAKNIKNLLQENYFSDIEIVKSIGSTSNYLYENNKTFKENKLLIALEQTNGVGQYGKKYYSHGENGLYFSYIIKGSINKLTNRQITMILAIAIIETFKSLYDIKLTIKWVNDIFLNNRKVSGILVQTTYDGDNMDIIVGIGINLYKPESDYEEEINNIASNIFTNEKVSKELIIASIINYFFYYCQNNSEVHSKYVNNSLVYKKEVYLNDELVFVDEIKEDGSLIIIKHNQIFNVLSGHIKLRGEV